jgi:type IV secretory pathway VirB6-like protein
MPFAANQNTIWDRVDCMADFIIGIKGASVDGAGVSEGAGEAGISRGLIFFFMSNLASPGTGFFIGVMGIYVLWSFVMAMIKALHTYLASILAISFILLLAPLFFPLLLFKKTRQYFDKWYRMLGSFILQPVILFAFLSMMMIALDYMLVSGRYSVLNAACGEVCVMDGSAVSNPERLNRHLESSGALGETGMRQDVVLTDNYAHIGGLNNERQGMVEGLVRDGSADRPSDTDNGALVTGRAFTELKYDALAAVMGDGAPEDRKIAVMLAMVLLTLTMFVFLSFLNYIPVLATDITGGMFEVPNLANEVGNHIPMGTQIEQASRQISDSVRGRGSSQMADYTRRMGEMLGMR